MENRNEICADSPALDRELLDELLESYGLELIVELRDSLRQEAAEDFAGLTAAVAERDAVEASRRLHSVRGAALNLGCAGFGELAQLLEKSSKEGTVPSQADLAALFGVFDASMAELDALSAPAAA